MQTMFESVLHFILDVFPNVLTCFRSALLNYLLTLHESESDVTTHCSLTVEPRWSVLISDLNNTSLSQILQNVFDELDRV